MGNDPPFTNYNIKTGDNSVVKIGGEEGLPQPPERPPGLWKKLLPALWKQVVDNFVVLLAILILGVLEKIFG